MQQLLRSWPLLLLSVWLMGCSVNKPHISRDHAEWQKATPKDSSRVKYTVFLIGDVGAPEKDRQEPSLKLLQSQLEASDSNSTVIFLGDNVYQSGFNAENAAGRKEDERRINDQLAILKNYKGEKYMIPGNHDWDEGHRDGLKDALREEAYVESQVTTGNFLVPDNGCPGPYEVLLQDDIVLIALNTQWWLHEHEKPYGDNNICEVANEVDFLVQLESIINRHKGKDIVVVGHHPMFSNGPHGGYFTIKDYLFPLTLLRDWAFIPLPVIGAIYPLSRKFGGASPQDIPHPRYQALREGLLAIFDKYPNIVYAAGHEHNLQYFQYNSGHYIVSGSGCKKNHADSGHRSTYTHRTKGFAKVMYYDNGEVWVEFWQPGATDKEDGSKGNVTFRTALYAKSTSPIEKFVAREESYKDSVITIAPNANYKASNARTLVLGKHYRKEWETPVKMPVLDLKTEQGGLTPFKKGGGKQTASLRFRNEENREFKIRSINKDPTLVLPEVLRETIARDILQDQISAQHPYSALVVPKLASAAKVYHTNPKLVYIPNDPRLGQWINQFGNIVGFVEENANENHANVRSLGNAENIVGADKMFERLQQDNDFKVDQPAFARARLLDMLVGDWDRHEGQWRWAEFKTDKSRLFRPVPQDRDIAFFKGDGFLPWLVSRKWAIRNFQNFGYDYGDVIGLNLSAINNDRALLSAVTKEQWLSIAQDLKSSITDHVIDSAVADLPDEVEKISGPEIAAKLKSRRNLLPEVASEFYEFLNKEVDVVGSDKHEKFVVNRLPDGQTEVVVYKITKEGEQKDELYRRTFDRKITKELHLYGRGGKDQFEISGKARKGIKIRVIGGEDDDKITDNSKVSGFRHHTVVYDNTTEKNELKLGPEARDKTDETEEVNAYERLGYKVPYVGPRLSFNFNVDDGIFIGGGVAIRTYSFRKEPYSTSHLLLANTSLKTSAFNLIYQGDYRQVFGKWNVGMSAIMNGPQLLFNYFGLGNDTKPVEGHPIDKDIQYYRVKFSRLYVSPTLQRDLTNWFHIGIGPVYERFKVERNPERFIGTPAANVSEDVFRANEFGGGRFFANIVAVSNPVNPRIGLRWMNELSHFKRLTGPGSQFTRLSSEFVFYLSPTLPFQTTLAARIGGARNYGQFQFYQANTLGGTTNLRGYRRTRFAGRSTTYANAELRLELVKFNVYLFPGKLGLMGLYDIGRVNHEGPESNKFHTGFGGGVWVDILKQAVITATYSKGEENLFLATFGFLF